MIRLRYALCALIALLGGIAATASPAAAAVVDDGGAEMVDRLDDDHDDDDDDDDDEDDDSGFRGEDIPVDLDWQSCFAEFGPDFECATAEVPLDYDRPKGRQISLALVRLPATGVRQASLFLNPGGPGGSGVQFVLGAGPFLYTPEVRASYDLIGIDPRGIGDSTPLVCFDSLDEVIDSLAPFPFPTTTEEERVLRRSNSILQRNCRRDGGAIKNHMSTANFARDLEVLRAAVGDDGLNFGGYSYGSVVGQVYSGLFPDRVDHIIIDGVLDIEDWVGSTKRRPRGGTVLNERIRSDLGAEETLAEFVRLCEESGEAGCALAPDAEARVNAILDGLREAPVEIVDPGTGEVVDTVTYASVISSILGALYDPNGWSNLAVNLAALEDLQAGETTSQTVAAMTEMAAEADESRMDAVNRRGPSTEPDFFQTIEGFPGVACLDTSNPSRFRAWSDAAERLSEESPNFGEIWSWVNSTCDRWPGFDRDRFVGPFGTETANPLLVMTTRYDPATSFAQARSAAANLPGSSLLTVDGWGHTTLFTSACADQALADYLLDDVLPENGTVCPPDVANPFTGLSIASAEAEAKQELLRHAYKPGR